MSAVQQGLDPCNLWPRAGFDRNGKRYSLLQYVLRETEQLHGSIRRYTSPDEAPFYPEDQAPLVSAACDLLSSLSAALCRFWMGVGVSKRQGQ